MKVQSSTIRDILEGSRAAFSSNGDDEVQLLVFPERGGLEDYRLQSPKVTFHCEDDKQSIELSGYRADALSIHRTKYTRELIILEE